MGYAGDGYVADGDDPAVAASDAASFGDGAGAGITGSLTEEIQRRSVSMGQLFGRSAATMGTKKQVSGLEVRKHISSTVDGCKRYFRVCVCVCVCARILVPPIRRLPSQGSVCTHTFSVHALLHSGVLLSAKLHMRLGPETWNTKASRVLDGVGQMMMNRELLPSLLLRCWTHTHTDGSPVLSHALGNAGYVLWVNTAALRRKKMPQSPFRPVFRPSPRRRRPNKHTHVCTSLTPKAGHPAGPTVASGSQGHGADGGGSGLVAHSVEVRGREGGGGGGAGDRGERGETGGCGHEKAAGPAGDAGAPQEGGGG